MPFSPKLVRIARRLLIGLGVFATIIALAATIEIWRGERAWKQCIAEHAAAGDPLVASHPKPPSPPSSENFFNTPALGPIMAGKSKLPEIPTPIHPTGWSSGVFSNLEAIAHPIRGSLKHDWPQESTTFSIIRHVLEPLDTTFNDVRNGAIARPYTQVTRFELKSPKDLFTSSETNFDTTYRFARLMILNACLNRAEGKLEESYADTLAGLKLASGLLTDSRTILETMVGAAILTGNIQPVWEGCQQHAWSIEQLAEFQKQFEKCQIMPSLRSAFLSERNTICQIDLVELERLAEKPSRLGPVFASILGAHNKVAYVRRIDLFISITGSHSQPDFVPRLRQLQHPRHSKSPYRVLEQLALTDLARLAIESIEPANSRSLALTACALERHWLAHSKYPETLAELVPTYLDKVPVDLIDGQPLRYRRTDDGKFLLYSLGLDGKDDGGKLSDSEKSENAGDWVWPMLAASGNQPVP